MTKNYRPDVAYPAELAQGAEHFASGVNDPGELRGLALSGRHFGITASEIRTGLLEELDLYTNCLQRCFVDSGAFSEVKFPSAGPPVVVREITDAQWQERLAIAERIAITFRGRAYVVAPDRVGCQTTTLARLARYGAQVAAIASHGAQIIVPVQKGALPMSAFYARACATLNLATAPIAGVPMKKDATSLAELAELVESLPWFGARIHLLGLGPSATRGKIKFRDVVALIKSIRPNAQITSDSVTIRRLVGRTNGKAGSPRALTAAQDQARAQGLTGSDVKAAGLVIQGFAEIDAERVVAEDAGWFDVELYDSVEEARVHRLAGYPDETPAPAPAPEPTSPTVASIAAPAVHVPPADAERCQRWLEGRHTYRPAREVIDTKRLEVVELDEATAKDFVVTHHYSKRYPAARFRFGLMDRGEHVGTAVFSRPFRAEVITNPFPWLDDVEQGAELGRFVLLDQVGANGETWFLARCFQMLRGRLRAVVSFSDPTSRTNLTGDELFPGHIGTIYQASNAGYAGKTNPATIRLFPDATVFSNMASGKILRGLVGWRSAAAELERFGADALCENASDIERVAWLKKWRNALTRPMRHRGLHRYTFALDRDAPVSYGPRRAYPKKAA